MMAEQGHGEQGWGGAATTQTYPSRPASDARPHGLS